MDFEKLCYEFNENKRLLEELQAMQDSIKAQILEIMNGATEYVHGAYKATYKPVTSTRLDTAGIKKDLPDVYLAYSSVSSYNRFIIS